MTYILQTDHLTKTIGGRQIIKDVSLHVKKGEIYGFLGPNGAGKSTVMKMLANLWKPTSGSIEMFGGNTHPIVLRSVKAHGKYHRVSLLL